VVFCPEFVGLFAVALTACGGATKPSQTVTVRLSEFKIEASQTTFTPGRSYHSYHFVVTNQDAANHESMIMPPSMHGMSMHDMHDMALAMMDKIPLGQTQSLDVTFGDANATGGLELVRYHSGRYEARMKQVIALQSQDSIVQEMRSRFECHGGENDSS
jgi:hypothetical protein